MLLPLCTSRAHMLQEGLHSRPPRHHQGGPSQALQLRQVCFRGLQEASWWRKPWLGTRPPLPRGLRGEGRPPLKCRAALRLGSGYCPLRCLLRDAHPRPLCRHGWPRPRSTDSRHRATPGILSSHRSVRDRPSLQTPPTAPSQARGSGLRRGWLRWSPRLSSLAPGRWPPRTPSTTPEPQTSPLSWWFSVRGLLQSETRGSRSSR